MGRVLLAGGVLLWVCALFQCCDAIYVTWGDVHIVAIYFFSSLGGFFLLFTVGGIMWFACGRAFFRSFKEEVAQTHREHHPWPPGSVRWRIQQMVKSSRRSGETRFPPQRLTAEEYLGVAPSAMAPSHQYRPPSQARSYMSGGGGVMLDRPTYFTPTSEKGLAPVREEFEEYRITREESSVSAADAASSIALQQQRPLPPGSITSSMAGAAGGLCVIRTTTATHMKQEQQFIKPNTYI